MPTFDSLCLHKLPTFDSLCMHKSYLRLAPQEAVVEPKAFRSVSHELPRFAVDVQQEVLVKFRLLLHHPNHQVAAASRLL